MPTQAPSAKVRLQQFKFPLIGRVPWFREPFKVGEPVNGTFLKVYAHGDSDSQRQVVATIY